MQPRIDKLSCQTYPIGGSAGPTAQAQRRHLLQANAAHLGMVRCSQSPAAAFCEAGMLLFLEAGISMQEVPRFVLHLSMLTPFPLLYFPLA